jgi:hypothetical protein
MCYRTIFLSRHNMELHIQGVVLPIRFITASLTLQWVLLYFRKFLITAIVLSSCHHRPINLTDMRHTTQLWQSFGRRVEPALIGQKDKSFIFTFAPLVYVSTNTSNTNGNCSKPIDFEGLRYAETFKMKNKLSCVKNIQRQLKPGIPHIPKEYS